MSQKIIITTFDLEEFKGILRNLLLECFCNSATHSSYDKLSERFISRKEAAQALGISLPTLSKLVKNGDVPAIRLGGKVVFKKSEIVSALRAVQSLKFKRG